MESKTIALAKPFVALLAAILAVTFLCASVQAQDNQPIVPDALDQSYLVNLPIINLQAANPNRVIIQGQLLVNGEPLPHVPFMIGACEDDTHTNLAKTDAYGFYSLTLPRAAGAGELSVALTYPATRTVPYTGTIGMYRSICTTSAGGRAALPAIELGAVAFEQPQKGETVNMPFNFVWQSRQQPAQDEVYQVVGTIQYDCIGCDPVEVAWAEIEATASGATNSVEFGCIQSSSQRRDVRSGEFRIVVTNATGAGASEPRYIGIGRTIHCAG